MNTSKNEKHYGVIKKNHRLQHQEAYLYHKVINKYKTPNNFGDRFIPRRYLMEDNLIKVKYDEDETETDVLSTGPIKLHRDRYAFTLKKVFNALDGRTLVLSDPANEKIIKIPDFKSLLKYQEDWQCRPRNKQQSYKIGTYGLDEDEIDFTTNMFDCSKYNDIAGAMGKQLLTWSLGKIKMQLLTHASWKVNCLAFSPCGKYLAVGGPKVTIKIFCNLSVECLENNLEYYKTIFCHSLEYNHAQILSLAWNKEGDYIVAGSSYGEDYVFNFEKKKVFRKLSPHSYSVVSVQFSPTNRYMASGDIKGNIVIYKWENCCPYLRIQARNVQPSEISTYFSFHPWNDEVLAVAEVSPATISIMNLSERVPMAHYGRFQPDLEIAAISFNKITAELLVNFVGKDGNGPILPKIHIFSSLTKVVEVYEVPLYGARFLTWSADHSSLITLSCEPAIIAWKFIPDSELKAIKTKKKKLTGLSPEMFKWLNIR